MVIFATFQRELVKGRKPEIIYATVLGVPILPYVHIPNSIPSEKLKVKQEIKKLVDVAVVVELDSPVLRKKNLKR